MPDPDSAGTAPAQPLCLLYGPQPPTSGQWRDVLRWLVWVMDDADEDLGFIASLLYHSRQYGDLSTKQARFANRVWQLHVLRFETGGLECQR